VLLCVQTMVLAAYLVHEAAHYTLFATPAANRRVGEWVGFIAGACYASFERIRHMHIRHHRDRADVTCFDFKGQMQRSPALKRVLRALEWAYIPATEILMHWQVIVRPFFVASERRHLARAAAMLLIRGTLLVALGVCLQCGFRGKVPPPLSRSPRCLPPCSSTSLIRWSRQRLRARLSPTSSQDP
jgi:fatty acid desaturase